MNKLAHTFPFCSPNGFGFRFQWFVFTVAPLLIFCWFVFPLTEVLSQIRLEVTRKVGGFFSNHEWTRMNTNNLNGAIERTANPPTPTSLRVKLRRVEKLRRDRLRGYRGYGKQPEQKEQTRF